jgi:hypothetical protein
MHLRSMVPLLMADPFYGVLDRLRPVARAWCTTIAPAVDSKGGRKADHLSPFAQARPARLPN